MTTDDTSLGAATDQRLSALNAYRILDTDPEGAFDDIVKLASHLCSTPVALVSLVEADRQWFKARVGFELCETPISQSVCQHALRQTETLVIPDLTVDPRTASNTLVTEPPFIRFYAGAPLVTPAGVVIGTLCVIDTVVRPEGLTDTQTEMIEALARQVIVQMEYRKALQSTHGSAVESRYERDVAQELVSRAITAEEAGGIGTFELTIDGGAMKVSPEFCRLFGLPVRSDYNSSDIEKLVLPEDNAIRSSALSRSSGDASLDVEYRIRRADTGELRWIARRAQFYRDGAGVPVAMFGSVLDVTDRHRLLEQQTRLLLLGDQLRDAETSLEVSRLAAKALGETLGVDRAGYGTVDRQAGSFTVLDDWASSDLVHVAGEHSLASFAITADKLATGETLAIANIAAADWLKTDRDQYRATGTASMIDIPLIDHGELVGIVFAHHGTARTWRVDEVDFAHAVADRTYAALAKLDAEAGQELLNRELGHRMKNQLALVQAIVSQTLRSADNLQAAAAALIARIQVLAGAHDMLIAGAAGRTTVGEIVRKVVLLHDDRFTNRFNVTGAEIVVASRPALSLSLILHELSTNAAKYGALSSPDGFVNIDWRIDRNEHGSQFVLHWSEHGGPVVVEPTRKGSGSRLIRAGLSGVSEGDVRVEYLAEGLHCEVVAELTSFQTER